MRSIKHDYFLDYELDQLSEVHQKLFIGLWLLADKEGKLVDHPLKIKAQVFPYRDYDVDPLLDDLHNAEFIARYEVAGVACIKVLRFEKHQKPHPKEPALGLPHPPENIPSREKTRLSREKTGVSREKKFMDSNQSRRDPGRDPALAVNGLLVSGSGGGEPKPEALPATPPKSVPLIYEAPTIPPEKWGYEEFFQWAQSRRIASGLLGEEPIRFEKLRFWWATVIQHDVGVERLKEAYYAYGENDFWAKKTPKHPFHGFMSQWKSFVPQEEAA